MELLSSPEIKMPSFKKVQLIEFCWGPSAVRHNRYCVHAFRVSHDGHNNNLFRSGTYEPRKSLLWHYSQVRVFWKTIALDFSSSSDLGNLSTKEILQSTKFHEEGYVYVDGPPGVKETSSVEDPPWKLQAEILGLYLVKKSWPGTTRLDEDEIENVVSTDQLSFAENKERASDAWLQWKIIWQT